MLLQMQEHKTSVRNVANSVMRKPNDPPHGSAQRYGRKALSAMLVPADGPNHRRAERYPSPPRHPAGQRVTRPHRNRAETFPRLFRGRSLFRTPPIRSTGPARGHPRTPPGPRLFGVCITRPEPSDAVAHRYRLQKIATELPISPEVLRIRGLRRRLPVGRSPLPTVRPGEQFPEPDPWCSRPAPSAHSCYRRARCTGRHSGHLVAIRSLW